MAKIRISGEELEKLAMRIGIRSYVVVAHLKGLKDVTAQYSLKSNFKEFVSRGLSMYL